MKRSKRKNRTQNGNSKKSLGRYLKGVYIRFLKIRGEPTEIAMGLALGTMVGMTPFMGFHTVIAIFLAALWKCNKIAAAIGVFITNPFTAPLIYPITYWVGKAVLGVSNISNPGNILSIEAVVNLIKNSPLILVDLTIGGIILGLPVSIACYWISLMAIENYRRKIKPKLHKRRDQKAVQKTNKKKKPGQKQ